MEPTTKLIIIAMIIAIGIAWLWRQSQPPLE